MTRSADAEVLGKLQSLALIVGLEASAVKPVWSGGHAFIDKPSDDLPVFKDERGLVAAHFKHAA